MASNISTRSTHMIQSKSSQTSNSVQHTPWFCTWIWGPICRLLSHKAMLPCSTFSATEGSGSTLALRAFVLHGWHTLCSMRAASSGPWRQKQDSKRRHIVLGSRRKLGWASSTDGLLACYDLSLLLLASQLELARQRYPAKALAQLVKKFWRAESSQATNELSELASHEFFVQPYLCWAAACCGIHLITWVQSWQNEV